MEILTLSILNFVSGLFTLAFDSVSGIIQGAFKEVLTAFGQNAYQIAENFATKLNAFGSWSPVVLVFLIGTFGIVVYMMLMGTTAANDLI